MDKIFELIAKEKKRQSETLMMIPSENYTYPEVMSAVGSVLMQKYAEGQPGKRYYQGMENVDEIERICEDRALELFGLNPEKWTVNVQPYSGTPANLAIYNTFLTPGDKILAMYLPDGGHLSHGWEYKGNKITFTSKVFDVHFYHVDPKSQVFDYDAIAKLAQELKPKLLISGGTAYPREIDHRKMGAIAHSAHAYYLADVAHEAGLIAGGANRSPFPYADAVTMTTHKTLRGPRGALAFVKKEYGEDLDRAIFPGLQGGPHLHTIAGIAVALRQAQGKPFKRYAMEVVKNAKALSLELSAFGFKLISGGTDKHLILIDLRSKKTNGWFAAWALEAGGIVTNRNTVPYDPGSPYYPSGLRLGTPALTARGMGVPEMKKIAGWINQVVEHIGERNIPDDPEERKKVLVAFKEELKRDKVLRTIRGEVILLCKKFPV